LRCVENNNLLIFFRLPMTVFKNILQQKRSALTILISAVTIGLIYPLLADKAEDWVARLNGLLIGLLGGLSIIFYELHVFFFPRKIYSFVYILAVKIILYTLTFVFLIILTVSITRSIESHVSYLAYIQGSQFHHFLWEEDFPVIASYTLTAVFIVITTRQVSRKMGRGELFHYITGKYHTPKREHRIFLAIDLQNSTALAERLGELKYHEFLKQYFYDLTHSIALHEGQIYRYVGDQVMVSWLLPVGLKNSNAFRCFFDATTLIEQREDFYASQFGVIPKFRGALDMGEVLTAEIGLDKQQLVFYGDVMERIGTIEKVGKQENQNLLVSEYLAVPLRQARELAFTRCNTLLETSGEPVQLFMVRPIAKV
jgi:adenylate cyclase